MQLLAAGLAWSWSEMGCGVKHTADGSLHSICRSSPLPFSQSGNVLKCISKMHREFWTLGWSGKGEDWTSMIN